MVNVWHVATSPTPALASIVIVAHVTERGAASHAEFASRDDPEASLRKATSGLVTCRMLFGGQPDFRSNLMC